LEYCQETSTVSPSDALAVLNCMSDWVVNQVRVGREVDFGDLGQTRLGMKVNAKSLFNVDTRREGFGKP